MLPAVDRIEAVKRANGAAMQYDAMYKRMTADRSRSWNLHVGSAGYVLLRDDAQMDIPLPIAIRNVQTLGSASFRVRVAVDAAKRFSPASER